MSLIDTTRSSIEQGWMKLAWKHGDKRTDDNVRLCLTPKGIATLDPQPTEEQIAAMAASESEYVDLTEAETLGWLDRMERRS